MTERFRGKPARLREAREAHHAAQGAHWRIDAEHLILDDLLIAPRRTRGPG